MMLQDSSDSPLIRKRNKYHPISSDESQGEYSKCFMTFENSDSPGREKPKTSTPLQKETPKKIKRKYNKKDVIVDVSLIAQSLKSVKAAGPSPEKISRQEASFEEEIVINPITLVPSEHSSAILTNTFRGKNIPSEYSSPRLTINKAKSLTPEVISDQSSIILTNRTSNSLNLKTLQTIHTAQHSTSTKASSHKSSAILTNRLRLFKSFGTKNLENKEDRNSLELRLSSYESDIDARSINSMSSMAISSLSYTSKKSECFEDVEDASSSRTNLDTTINGYVTSRTTLFDVCAKRNLDFSVDDPSDVTGSDEDISVVFQRRYQQDIARKQQQIFDKKMQEIKLKEERKNNFKTFCIRGIIWDFFNHEQLKFKIKPKDFYPKEFSSKRIYKFSMCYNGKRWNIKTFLVPSFEVILKLYEKSEITDAKLNLFLQFVVDVIFNSIREERKLKQQRARDFRAGIEMDLNSSDEELLFNDVEREEYREKKKQIWNRMLPPTKLL